MHYVDKYYYYKDNVSNPIKIKETYELANQLLKSVRPGIGLRSKLVFTNPVNLNVIRKIFRPSNTVGFMSIEHPYRVITTSIIPPYELVDTGDIIFKKNQFVNYEYSNDNILPYDEYVEMCLFFGWAKKKIQKQILFYVLDDKQAFGIINGLLKGQK